MDVEVLGLIGSSMGSIAEGLGGAASVSGSAAPAVAGLAGVGLEARFGPVMGPVSLPFYDSPVAPIFLENTMPLQIGKLNPVREIRFNEPLLAPKVMTEAVVAEAKHWLGIVEPKLPSWEVQLGSQSKTESRISSQTAQVVLSAPATKEQEVEKLVKEKVKAEEPREVLGEEEFVEKRLYLEDQEAVAVRRFEIRRAIKLAFTIVGNLVNVVTGAMVARFLPAEHEGNRSQVVKKTGPDGSYQETVEAITDAGELELEDKAVTRFDEIVAEKKPVKVGKNGTPVANEDVVRVFKYRILKPVPVYEIVINRVKRQIMQVVPGWETETKAEKSLEELDPILAGVFRS